MTLNLAIEIASAIAGVAGTLLLAMRGPLAGWGFVAYLVSNVGWIAFAWLNQHWGLLAQNLAFTAVSLYGVWTWLIAPRIDRALDRLLDGEDPAR